MKIPETLYVLLVNDPFKCYSYFFLTKERGFYRGSTLVKTAWSELFPLRKRSEELFMKTMFETKESVERKWCVIDAQGQVLGRLATEIARRLCGKHKPTYTPHIDTGDYIIVINAEKVRLTGDKLEQKIYHWHTGYPSGLRSISAKNLLQRNPERVIEYAVKGMLPKTKLGRRMFKKMKVYVGSEHPHTAQQPEVLTLKARY
jgi:large subunit ribosomal protein L13